MKTERQKDQEVVERLRAENLARAGLDVVDAGDCASPVLASEMTNDAAVAWRIRIGVSDDWSFTYSEEDADFYGKNSGLPYVKEALVPATTVAELRAEVERLTEQLRYVADACEHETARADAAERRVAEAESVCRAVLGTFQRNLASEEACGQPFMGDDEHEAIRLLTKFLTKESK